MEYMLGVSARDSVSLLVMWSCHLTRRIPAWDIADRKCSSDVSVLCRWSKFHCHGTTCWERMLGTWAFWFFPSGICFPRLSRWLFGRFLCLAQVNGGEFVDCLESVVADFDFRGLADILGTHIGFLETDYEAKVFTCAGEFVDEPLQCCLGKHCQRRAFHSQKQFWRWSWRRDEPGWRVFPRYWYEGTHRQLRSQRDRTGGERGEDSKECRGYDTALIGKGSGINTSKYTVHVMISNITSSSHNYQQNNNNNNNNNSTLT